MTPISAIVSRLVSRMLDRKQPPEPEPRAPVPEDPELARQAEAWIEPEPETPLFSDPRGAAWPADLFAGGDKR